VSKDSNKARKTKGASDPEASQQASEKCNQILEKLADRRGTESTEKGEFRFFLNSGQEGFQSPIHVADIGCSVTFFAYPYSLSSIFALAKSDN